MGDGVREKRRICRKTCDKPHYPYELPEGWCWTNVGDIASSILYGVSESAKSEGEYKLLRITDIQDNAVNWKTVPHTDFDETKVSDYLLSDGDILFARTGATVGKSYLVHGIKCKAIYASYLIRVQTFKDVLPEYVKRFFESGFYWEQIQGSSVGIGQPNVNGTILSQLMIPIPPKEEQYRIVENLRSWLSVVDVIEDGKESLQTSIKQTKSKILDLAIHGKLVPQDPTDDPASELLKRINPKAVIACDNPHYRKLPKGWIIAHLSNIAEIKNGYAFKSSNYISSNGIRIIRIANVQDAFIEDKTPQYYPKESCDDIEKFFLKEKDLLMSLTGNVGRVGLLPQSFLPAALNQRVACIRENELLIDKEYLYYLFQSNEFQRKCIKSAKGVAQLNISTEWIKCYQIPIPPLAEQKRIVETISLLFANLRMIEASL